MTKTGTVHTEGANIVYDYEGAGPLLLTIAGGGGDAHRYAPLSSFLADAYMVVNYDRRGNARSTGDSSADLDMAQSARDAAAVIRAMGADKAFVFGNSAGANIGLKLAEDIPEVITGLVAHEPPVMSLLPDAEIWQGFVQRVHETYANQGTGPAMKLFASSLVGFDAPPQPPPGAGNRIGGGPNMDFFMSREYLPISTYVPDLDAISRNHVSVVMAAGRRSADAYYARTARLLAERLSCRYAEFPGNHMAFINDTEAFAVTLREALQGLRQDAALTG
ncbi:MAG: alpha/beta hydrolase [Chloroflexota bacterium]|nr:alpha/beta hydrolase [Chloroflexota bacterium]